jgi:hypothetical protein
MWSLVCIETLSQTTKAGQSKHEPPGKGLEESREIKRKSALRSLTERQVHFYDLSTIYGPLKAPFIFTAKMQMDLLLSKYHQKLRDEQFTVQWPC